MKITKSKLFKILKEEILKEMTTGDERFARIRQALESGQDIPPEISREFTPMEADFVRHHRAEERLHQLRSFFLRGERIPPLRNLSDSEKKVIFKSLGELGNSPGIRNQLTGHPMDQFPLRTSSAIHAAFEDFVAEKNLNEDPQFKEGFEDHDYTTHYFDIHNQLVLGTIRSAGGDYLYNHIEEKGLLPELEEKIGDYVQKYTNPRKRPAKIQIIPYTDYQWNEDRYGEEL